MIGDRLSAFRSAGEDLFHCGLVIPGSGNLSVWTPDGVLITREAAPLHRLTEADLCLISRTTEPPASTPSLDTPIHRAIYVSASAKAIVHAHPVHIIALTIGKHRFEPIDLEGRHLLGVVPVVSPRRSVVDLVAQASAASRVVIVEGHGTYARGASFEEAVHLTAMLEESARIAAIAQPLPRPLPKALGRGA
jgi:L-fuculose-phosphate aldolase